MDINRRNYLAASGGALLAVAWRGLARAQETSKIRRIGLLSPYSPADAAPWFQAFREGLRELGWIEGRNISIEYRYAEGKPSRLPDFATDLVRSKIEVIVVNTTTDASVAKKATTTIPIVMATAGDPVSSGYAESLVRPGGNVTGLSQMTEELVGKRLELLADAVPGLSRVAVFGNPQNSATARYWKALQVPARGLGIELHSQDVRSSDDIDRAFEAAMRARAGALFVMSNHVFSVNLHRVAHLAAKNRLPSIYHRSEFADAGGFMSYGPDRADMYRRAASYVDKILKGAKPGDLPIEQPTKFELVVNMKTAKTLGLSIPQTILVRADRVIQ